MSTSQQDGRSTDHKSPIGSGRQDVGHTSFFTGCEKACVPYLL
ncbi:hypothetical protein [Lysinibacillus fusiformis]